MPDNEINCRYQDAVVWEQISYNDFGEVTVGTSKNIKVRIEKGKKEVLDPSGNRIASPIELAVGEHIPVGSLVWLGNPKTMPEETELQVYQTTSYQEIPDVSFRKKDRWVKLTHYGKIKNTATTPTAQEEEDDQTVDPIETIFHWYAGLVSKTDYDAWYDTIPDDGTTGRPKPNTNNYSLVMSNGHELGAVINYEVPTMEASGVLKSRLWATHHNDHTMLSPENSNSDLLDWRYFKPGQNYRTTIGIDLKTDNYTVGQWESHPWCILWQLHPGAWPSGWSDTKSPPIALYNQGNNFSLHVRGSTATSPTAYEVKNTYDWDLETGYHEFIIDVRIDYTGVDALVKITMDNELKHTVTHTNGINHGGNTVYWRGMELLGRILLY